MGASMGGAATVAEAPKLKDVAGVISLSGELELPAREVPSSCGCRAASSRPTTRLVGERKGDLMKKAALALLAAAVLGTTAAAIAWAAGGDSAVIHACVAKGSDLVRIPGADACRPNESGLDWNAQGPVGPAGPQGPAGPSGCGGARTEHPRRRVHARRRWHARDDRRRGDREGPREVDHALRV